MYTGTFYFDQGKIMLKKNILIILLLLLVCSGMSYSQKMHNRKKIIEVLGYTARSYLLSANRPSIGVDADLTPKNHVSFDFGTVFSSDFIEFPVGLEYGISNYVNLVGGFPVYTQSYKFAGTKIDGFGDAHLGLKFKLQESEKFIHSFQFAVKIPTASKSTEMGTGKVDYHFGIAEGFSADRFSYELSAELNLLRRRDLPSLTQYNIGLLQSALDSLRNYYSYKFEPEMLLSFVPAYDISKKTTVYSGIAFSRNFKLDFNTAQLLAGAGYLVTDKASVTIGSSFGIINGAGWLVSAGVYFIL